MNLYLQHCLSNCVAASAHGYTCNNHCNLKSSCVACESKNVSHVASQGSIQISISVSSSEINKDTETERVFKIKLLMV